MSYVSLVSILSKYWHWILAAVGTFFVILIALITAMFSTGSLNNQGCSSGTGTPITLTGNSNIAQIWNFFIRAGISASGTASIMGNIGVESAGTFDPNIHQYGGGQGLGIAQWSDNGRWLDLVLYADSEGLSPTSLTAQLNFMLNEMRSGHYGTYDATFNAMSIPDATAYFCTFYEEAGVPHEDSRLNYAMQFYNEFGNSSPAVTVTSTSNSQPVITTTCGSTTMPAPANASDQAKKLIQFEEQFLGVPYLWGGTTPAGFDCSGLQMYSFRNALGINLPRTAAEQQLVGIRISPTEVQPGDLIFEGFPAFHVGLYIGNNKWIEAPETGEDVKISNYNPSHFTSASRVIN